MINQAFFGALTGMKTHISSKTESLFSSVPMEQRLMCRYLTVEKQGLLCLIAAVEPQDPEPGTPDHGPRVSDHGPLVLAL
jgi:hypothetical protein